MDLTLKAKKLENDLKVAEDDGDPMEVWTKYHEWLEENKYTSHPSYSDALMQSIKYFGRLNNSNSDIRLANIYIKLAGVSGDSEAVFKHMLGAGVCVQHAVVYDAYAKSLELAGSLQAALQVLKQGIQNRAQPIARLHKRLDELNSKSGQLFSAEQRLDNKLKNSSQLDAKTCDQDSPRTEEFYCTPGIVVHYDKRRVYPSEGGELQIEEIRAMMQQYKVPPRESEQVEMEMTEVCFGNITLNVPMMAGIFKSHQLPANKENFGTQQPLGAAYKGPLKSTFQANSRRPLQLLSEQEDVDSELDRLCQEKPYQSEQFAPVSTLKELSSDSFSEALEELDIKSTEKSTSHQVQLSAVPTALEGSLGRSNTRLGDSVSTKLNFSDVESLSVSKSFQHTAAESMQSFEVFHDSAVKDTNRQHAKDLTRPPLQVQGNNVRRPLQVLAEKRPLMTSKPLLAAICNQENQEAECSESRSQLWQTSHQNSLAAGDGQESSFAPFHDSWAASSSNVVSKPLICQPVVHVPLEAPIMGHTMNSSCVEASFTQVGICHPKQFDPTSTPMGAAKGTDFTFDISVITDHHQPMAKALGPLSPITEEPSSFKSSSSSRSSNSTASSVPSEPPSSTHTHFPTEFNPFLPQYVNTMLNTLSHSAAGDNFLIRLNSPLPKFGTTICLDGRSLNLKKINEGGFATIYMAKEENDSSLHTFKVQSPPCEWEVVVMAEVRERLKKGSSKFLRCFMEVEKAFIFTDSSVISFPYLASGTLLDLSNACRSQTIDECAATFYTLEMLHIVHALHSVGIIHADIKPDNFMLRDTQQFPDSRVALGHGLCLTDFGRAIDTTAFSASTMFTGSCNTEDFQCVQMIENKPWKWQIDWFGLAASVYVLVAGKYMKVTKNTVTGLYKLHSNCPRRFTTVQWTKLFEKLINTSDTSILVQLISDFESKMKTFTDIVFSSSMKKTWSAHTQFLNR